MAPLTAGLPYGSYAEISAPRPNDSYWPQAVDHIGRPESSGPYCKRRVRSADIDDRTAFDPFAGIISFWSQVSLPRFSALP